MLNSRTSVIIRTLVSLLFLAPFATTRAANADDQAWPQWRGPNRDGHAAPQRLLSSWPEGGPELKWQFPKAGRGYSAVAVVGENLYTLGTYGVPGDAVASDDEADNEEAADNEACYAICLNADTGDLKWETKVSRASSGDDYTHKWGGGPRSTPTIDGDQLFVLTDIGVLASLDRHSGELQWSTDFVADHGGSIPNWGYSESVLVDGDRVVGTPGGENFMIAVDRNSGEKVWQSKGVDQEAQYVSVMKGQAAGSEFYVTASKLGLFAFDTESGELLFSDDSTGNRVAVIPTPVLEEDLVYHTSAYGAGNTLLRLKPSDAGGIEAEMVYHLEGKTMENHHGGVVLVDGVIYGNAKFNGGTWMAQDLLSGDRLWDHKADRKNNSGSICYADNRLYCYNDEDATVNLVEPSRDEWLQRGELKLPEQTEIPRGSGAIWTHPVVANQTLFLRDQDLLFAFDIADK